MDGQGLASLRQVRRVELGTVGASEVTPTQNDLGPRTQKEGEMKTATRNGNGTVLEAPQDDAPVGSIIVAPINIATYRFHIVGTSPLLTHRFDIDAFWAAEEAKHKVGVKAKREARNPQALFLAGLYLLPESETPKAIGSYPGRVEAVGGQYGIPSDSIKKAVASAAYRYCGAKNQVEILGALMMVDELIEIKSPNNPVMRADRVVLPGAGRALDVRFRPQFWPWTMAVDISFATSVVSLDSLTNVLVAAGQLVGVGDWRQEKKGRFGTFTLDHEAGITPITPGVSR